MDKQEVLLIRNIINIPGAQDKAWRTALAQRQRRTAVWLGIVFALAGAVGGYADDFKDISVDVQFDRPSYASGDTVVAIVSIDIPKGYHLYANPMGPGIGKPLTIAGEGSDCIQWTGLRKEQAKKYHPDMGEWVWAYEKHARFYLTGVVAGNGAAHCKSSIRLEGVICHTSCIAVAKQVDITVPLGRGGHRPFEVVPSAAEDYRTAQAMPMGRSAPDSGGELPAGLSLEGFAGGGAEPTGAQIPDWDYTPVEEKLRYNVALALVLAFLAGVILNVMPCVLPVLGIKILSFSQGTGASRATAVGRSLVFAAGMLTIFMVLASLAAFLNFSWGQQFQQPRVLAAIIFVIVLFALGLFDFYTILLPAGIGAASMKSGHGFGGEFLRGMFTTIMATPCSGPLLGATLAWTLQQPVPVIYLVFAAVGIGMAFPYVLLSSSKTLARLVPKPGKWMDDFKHVMGFLLLGFAVYLLIGLPSHMVVSTVGMCLFLVLAVAVYKRFAPFGSSRRRRTITGAYSLSIVALGFWFAFEFLHAPFAPKAEEQAGSVGYEWAAFAPQTLEKAHMEGRHVVVDFTAMWCLNCQYNKMMVLKDREIVSLMEEKGVVALRGDLTGDNPPAQSLLEHLGSRSVPFLAIFPGDDPYHPIIMRDVLSKSRLKKALKALPEPR